MLVVAAEDADVAAEEPDPRCRQAPSSRREARRCRPAPAIDPDPPSYGTNGGNGGNIPYPDRRRSPADTATSPNTASWPRPTKPPYTTLTAYDLNKGAIRWQIAQSGDDPATVARGGPREHRRRLAHGYGSRHDQAPGLVFLICGWTATLRAYDEDTGKELWSRHDPGQRERRSRSATKRTAVNTSSSASLPEQLPGDGQRTAASRPTRQRCYQRCRGAAQVAERPSGSSSAQPDPAVRSCEVSARLSSRLCSLPTKK